MRVAAPWASAFVIYLLGISFSAFSLRKLIDALRKAKYGRALLLLAIGLTIPLVTVPFLRSDAYSAGGSVSDLEPPNTPMGAARGIFPGRVVWVLDTASTNEHCTNAYGDGYFLHKNTSQQVVDLMLRDALLSLTGENSIKKAWDEIFRHHNAERGKGALPYQPGEKLFIKINATSAFNFDPATLAKKNNSNYAITETNPAVISAVLRHLVQEVGIAQQDIYVGDPMKHVLKSHYEKWHGEFPMVHYLDHDAEYEHLGREAVVKSTTAIIDYSDRGTILNDKGSWGGYQFGNPIDTDFLYTIFEEMEYMLNIPTLKCHRRAGITMFAKNHFGSHTRIDANHLHGGLVEITNDGSNRRSDYGLYRVQVDLMGHELLGKKNLLYLVDALFSSHHETVAPGKWQTAPWNNDWTSSLFVSQDPVAMESVGFDFLYDEYDGTHGTPDYPHMGAVDDYLHQAADEANWPDGIIYDPENDGSKLGSLGVHEHWNNPIDRQYSRNLGTGEGIELIKVVRNTYTIPDRLTTENSELPDNVVNVISIDSSNTAWIGTSSGLSSLSLDGWKHYTQTDGLVNQHIHDVAFEYSEDSILLWIATDNGLTRGNFNDIQGIIAANTYHSSNSPMAGNRVFSVVVDPYHHKWVGTDSALNLLTGDAWISTFSGSDADDAGFTFSENLITDMVWSPAMDRLLVATEGKGISRLRYNDVDGITGASTYGTPWADLASNSIQAIAIDGSAQWYGTDLGVHRHMGEETKAGWDYYNLDSGLVAEGVRSLLADSESNIWIGTGQGLSILTPRGWYAYTVEEGLIDPVINTICEDRQGVIWVGTNGGIERFSEVPGLLVQANATSRIPRKKSTDPHLAMYPNPASDHLVISCENLELPGSVKIEIYSVLGMLYYGSDTRVHEPSLVIPIELNRFGIRPGTWIVKVETNHGSSSSILFVE